MKALKLSDKNIEKEKEVYLPSARIVRFATIGSMYADNKIRVFDDRGNEYRMDVSELLKSLDYAYPVFLIVQKRVWKYLEFFSGEGVAGIN